MKEGELEALPCPKGSLLCENNNLLLNCSCLSYVVVSRYLMCPTQLILHMPSPTPSLRHTACFSVDFVSMEGAEGIGLLLLSSKLARTVCSI